MSTTVTSPNRHRQIAEVEGSRFAVEYVSGGAMGGSMHKHLAEALAEGDSKGWYPLGIQGFGSLNFYITWDKRP